MSRFAFLPTYVVIGPDGNIVALDSHDFREMSDAVQRARAGLPQP
jgi:hypothetical protein